MNGPAELVARLVGLCEQERAAAAAGDIEALGAAALARLELAFSLAAADSPPPLAELMRLKAEVRRNLSLYAGLQEVTARRQRFLERALKSFAATYGPGG